MSQSFGITVALLVGAAILARPSFWAARAVRQVRGHEAPERGGKLYRLWYVVTVALGCFALAMAAWLFIYAE